MQLRPDVPDNDIFIFALKCLSQELTFFQVTRLKRQVEGNGNIDFLFLLHNPVNPSFIVLYIFHQELTLYS